MEWIFYGILIWIVLSMLDMDMPFIACLGIAWFLDCGADVATDIEIEANDMAPIHAEAPQGYTDDRDTKVDSGAPTFRAEKAGG